MNRDLESRQDDDVAGLIIACGLLAVLLLQIGRMMTTGGLFSGSLFVDSDVYMWLNRAEALADGRGWFDHVEPRINPPDGHVQHWTRPVDFMLLVGGYALSPLFGFRDGLALWGNIVSPLLMIAAVWAMYRISRFLLPRREAVLSAAVFMLHPMILLSYSWGRPDHHALLRLGQVLFLLLFLKCFLGDEHRRRWAFLAGWVGAWAIWFNVEALAFVLIAMAVLGLWWLVGRRDLIESNIALGAGLFGGITTAVAIERGPDFFVLYPIDTMGIAYVVLFGLVWLFWIGIGVWTRFGPDDFGIFGRGAVAAALAGGVLGAIAAVEPAFFHGPFAGVDELYREVRLQYIGEQLPALKWGIDPPLAMVGSALTLFGILLAGLGEFAKKIGGDEEPRIRWAWAMLGGMALLYGILALDTVRWSAYMPAGAAVGFAVLGGRILDAVEARRQSIFGAVLRPVAVGALLLGFSTVGLAMQGLSHHLEDRDQRQHEEVEGPVDDPVEEAVVGEGPDCDLRPAAKALSEIDGLSPDGLILIDPDRGSEVLYRTDHSVLAIANHRLQPGFTLFVETMTATDMEKAHDRLVERGVKAAMVCEPEIWPILGRDGQSVIERLGRGEGGGGFERLTDAREAGGWWIYKVGEQR